MFKTILATSVILVSAQSSFANVLDQVADGNYKVSCQKSAQYPVTFTSAEVSSSGNDVTVLLDGTSDLGWHNPMSLPLDFSRVASKVTTKSKPSHHDNIVVPGTVNEFTVIKNSNAKAAGIQEISKTKVGFVTVKSETTTILLSLNAGKIVVDMDFPGGEKVLCQLTK